MKKLKVGDRVEAIGVVDGVNLKGKNGVVKGVVHYDSLPVLVEFDEPFEEGHSGYGERLCKENHGRWGKHEDFLLLPRTSNRKVWVVERDYGRGFRPAGITIQAHRTRQEGLYGLSNLRQKGCPKQSCRLVKYVPEVKKRGEDII